MSYRCLNASSLDGAGTARPCLATGLRRAGQTSRGRASGERILAATVRLAQFPESGRPGRRAETRELVVSQTPYLVPYRVRGELVEVLRVLHGRQRWPDAF